MKACRQSGPDRAQDHSSQQVNDLNSLLAVLLIAATGEPPVAECTRGELAEDALYPEAGPFAHWSHGEYHRAVRRNLAAAEPGTMKLQMVVLPSLQAEYAVAIRQHGTLTAVEVHRAAESIWIAGESSVQRAMAADVRRTPEEAAAVGWSATKVDVVSVSAPIDSQLENVLQLLWASALRRTSFSHHVSPFAGFDGASYHFSLKRLDAAPADGWVWSPPDGSRLGELVAVAELLRRFVESPTVGRPRIREQIMQRSWDLLDRFEPESSFRAGRPPRIVVPNADTP